MGATKRHFYTESQLEMANLCKALGHPARITIIEKLSQNENLNCTDLKEYIPLAQSTISRHLYILYEIGILGYQVEKNSVLYKVNTKVVQIISVYLKNSTKMALQKPIYNLYTYFKPLPEFYFKT